ncbi:MAG TPA: PPC domain-containing protein, partial [Pilimelia sp.]|nr:PPC domain-containing protein [Pilimelia sp.]
MFNGTSMSAPQATGAAALLLSAARAQGVAVTPLTLRRAVYGTAKPLPGEPTYVQGHGMVSVPDAWKQLRSGPQAREYTVDAPVCTPLSGQLTRPHRGAGLYNRCAPAAGGHHPGQSRDYTVTVTRTTGPAGDVPHTLTWKGNDGTFSAPASVRLPLGTPTQVPVTAKPSAGVHSAILVVDDPATPLRDAEVSTVVTAPHRTLAAPDFRHEVAGTVQRNAVRSYLIDVPAGTATLELHLSKIATGSHTRFLAINPYGVPVENVASTHCFTNHSDPALCAPIRRSYADPLPGLWEVTVESRRTSPVLDNPYALVATALGVAVSPDPLTVPDAPAGTDVPVAWSLRNAFAPATVTAKAAALGSVRRQRPTIAEGAAHRYTVDVPAGAQRFTATIGGAADIGADLDLKVERDGAVVGQSADGDAEESVTLTNPEPGRYTVVVDGYEVPTGTTAYDYLDAFYAPALGMLRPAATTLELANGASAKLTGTLRAAGDPGEGRTLSGELQLVTDVGTVVGRGSVVVGPPA